VTAQAAEPALESADTVAHAASTPDREQPYGALGLRDEEYARIREILGRRPTDAELAMYAVMWSEHCSYKSSKVHLRRFGETTTDEMRRHLLAGIGENAGVVDVGDGWEWLSILNTQAMPSPRSTAPAFSPGPTRMCGPRVGSERRCTLLDL